MHYCITVPKQKHYYSVSLSYRSEDLNDPTDDLRKAVTEGIKKYIHDEILRAVAQVCNIYTLYTFLQQSNKILLHIPCFTALLQGLLSQCINIVDIDYAGV